MEIKKNQSGDSLVVEIIGRLDAATAPQLEKELNSSLEGIKTLTLDFSQLEYVASAGLRVLLVAQKRMNKQGSMTIKNVSDEVKEVLDMTGFISFLNIED
ncbi:MAG: STAS domain-containing protein [Selenomonadaceae bacterium]|nr:STAS domain-containing protein [Selenomonadaceae bacterium]